MKLIYLPLERYAERYTQWLSSMVKTYIDEYNIPCMAIMPHNNVHQIDVGNVLDPRERCFWGFAQTSQLVTLIADGTIESDDVIYIEDFWHPGFEMIPYTMSLVYGPQKEKWPKIYTFCHAQSVDPHDFTRPMAWWMREMEIAWSKCNSGIFVAAKELKQMLDAAGIGTAGTESVHAVGTVFKGVVLNEYAVNHGKLRGKRVVFSSRWDYEKRPEFFCSVAETIIKARPDIHFVVCTGRRKLTSDESLAAVAEHMERKYGANFKVMLGCNKRDYYRTLGTSMVQFNCADQDFVSYTLLEAAYFRCMPVYPRYLTFPDALNYNELFLYEKGNITSACEAIVRLIDNPDQVDESDLIGIYDKYQRSFKRMLSIMGFDVGFVQTLEDEHSEASNDF